MKHTAFAIIALALAGCASVTPRFQVGDLVMAQNFTTYPQYNGTPVVITGAFGWRWIKGPANTLRVYEITTTDGEKLAAQDFQLVALEK